MSTGNAAFGDLLGEQKEKVAGSGAPRLGVRDRRNYACGCSGPFAVRPEVLAAAAKHLQAHQRSITIVTKTVDGVPKDEILREAAALGADRIVLGSHGRGRGQRMILGSTAAAVAAEAQCTVHVARPLPGRLESSAKSHAA